jgi:ubiquinone/menaquinone biosynthesis C-methylase UbiE
MSAKIDLYDSAYANYAAEVYREVRVETYDQDLGQTSWVSGEESAEIPKLLNLKSTSSVLELGCGSGRYALHLSEQLGCSGVGVDINESGVHNANQLAVDRGLAERARFERCDASAGLPFGDGTFHAAFANDVLCHIPGRLNLLREVFRVLKTGGRMLFSDALVVGGMLSYEEIATRSSIGFYMFSPPGENERLLERAGLELLQVIDTTASAATIAERWSRAREKRKAALFRLEGAERFDGLQRFLNCVHTLTTERRLLRYVYVVAKNTESLPN